jgi:outer membrane protein assembly factor BamB
VTHHSTLTRRVAAVLALLASLTLGFGYGFLSHRNQLPPYAWVHGLADKVRPAPPDQRGLFKPAGKVKPGVSAGGAPAGISAGAPAGISANQIAALQALGYVAAVQPAQGSTGVQRQERGLAQPGLNFWTSAHDAEAYVMDMQGQVLHTWQLDAEDVWQDVRVGPLSRYWRRAHLFPNGDLLGVHSGVGLVKIDKDSKVLWKRSNGAHHDLWVTEDRIWTLGNTIRTLPELRPEALLDDTILELDSAGNTLSSISVIDAIWNSDYRHVLAFGGQDSSATAVDLLHTNTVEVIGPGFQDPLRAGRILVSMRNADTIGLIDPQTKRMVWAMTGMFDGQHEPTVLANGHLLVFDNVIDGTSSRVVELDPTTQEVVWSYRGEGSEVFHSAGLGSVSRLPNGDTLIIESYGGRAIEVSPAHEVVWQYVSPHRGGDKDELIAAMLDMIRLPVASLPWL